MARCSELGQAHSPPPSPRGHDHPHAVRVLARAWVYVLWRCWQDGVAYDPDRHAGLQKLIPVSGPAVELQEAALAAVS